MAALLVACGTLAREVIALRDKHGRVSLARTATSSTPEQTASWRCWRKNPAHFFTDYLVQSFDHLVIEGQGRIASRNCATYISKIIAASSTCGR